jgi:hypothetical protein
MTINLQNGDEVVNQNTIFQLNKSNVFISNKKNVNLNVFWYYEFTIYGGDYAFFIGFTTNAGSLGFYPESNKNFPRFWCSGSFCYNDNQRILLNHSIDDNQTFGIGIDLKKRLFSFYDDNYTFSYKFPVLSLNDFNMYALGGRPNDLNTTDTVSINFGNKEFKFNVPGSVPWNECPSKTQCRESCRTSLRFLCFIIILV